MISSAIPSVKYSLSGSALMFVNGSTATDFAADTTVCGSDAVSVGVTRLPDASAWPNCAAVEYRPDASIAIALVTAFSTDSGIELLMLRSDLGISEKRFAITACGVAPLNGRSPLNISYITQARLYWSLLPSRF